jgi:hypothetical protein
MHKMRAIAALAMIGSLLAPMLAARDAGADGNANADLAKFLEDNAVASAYAMMCDEEPVADQLKANTMVLLAVNGLPPHNVQLGSAKYNEVMRREVAATKNPKALDCRAQVASAKSRLAQTLAILQATHRPEQQ